MAILRITEAYDGRLPIYHVIKEIVASENNKTREEEIIKSFDTYEEADRFCAKLIADSKARDHRMTSCGEEDPCN